MAKTLLSDELWSHIEPFFRMCDRTPREVVSPVPNRAALTGILFMLKTGLPWEHLPKEMNCGSGMTCWRRLHEWQQAGVWRPGTVCCLSALTKRGS